MGRLFTFGCSFTQYSQWPTWADILGREFDYYENWGKMGAGNQYIFHSIVECNERNKFTSNDTVVIMWTQYDREDRYVSDKWMIGGNIHLHKIHSKEWVKEFSCSRGYAIRDLSFISAVKDILAVNNTNYKFLSMVSLNDIDRDIKILYNNVLQTIKPSVQDVIFNGTWGNKKSDFAEASKEKRFFLEGNRDFHPTPEEHLEYLEKVLPEFDISGTTKDWVYSYKHNDEFNRHFPKQRF